jgi:16S rRNA (guanine(966)-N(2))-methyltransferase RsmD
MRVITGTARGKRLKELSGMETRPTTDRVKEGLFNIIQFDIEGRRVLDLFGGTGQLGIECLSRGAERAVFVDQRKDAVALIRENLKATNLSDRGQVVQGDSIAYLSTCREKFHLIFLDPPYASGLMENALENIVRFDILSENGIIICETPVERALPELPEPYRKGKEYRYGKIKLTLYRRDAD